MTVTPYVNELYFYIVFSSHRRALGTAFSQRDGAAQAEAQAEEAEAAAAEESLCFVSVH